MFFVVLFLGGLGLSPSPSPLPLSSYLLACSLACSLARSLARLLLASLLARVLATISAPVLNVHMQGRQEMVRGEIQDLLQAKSLKGRHF